MYSVYMISYFTNMYRYLVLGMCISYNKGRSQKGKKCRVKIVLTLRTKNTIKRKDWHENNVEQHLNDDHVTK